MIEGINHALMDLEYARAPDPDTDHQLLLVVGPPRSGTTVVTQILAYGLMTGYVTNIAARFWNAPALGTMLSVDILGTDPAGDMGRAFLASDLGQTPHGGGIHEFGYFWRNLNWERPALEQIERIQTVLDKPLVMKGVYAAHHAKTIREHFGERVSFIAVQRPFTDVLASILSLYAESGEPDFWFRGWELPSARDGLLASLSEEERTAARIHYWMRLSNTIADYQVYLPNVCKSPDAVLEAFARTIAGIDSYRAIPPDWLSYRSYAEVYPSLASARFNAIVERVCEGLT